MNIHELNYVLCIAKHQNMTKAARELYISQPTLSKHLGKLERELGIKLFNRVDNCYIPTYAGRRYMEYASRVLELTRNWEKELEDLRSLNDGELNVAFPLMRSSGNYSFWYESSQLALRQQQNQKAKAEEKIGRASCRERV